MLKLTIPLAVAIGLFAEGSSNGDPLAPWANLTALGIVGLCMVFIVTKMLPDLHKKFVDQSEIFAKTGENVVKNFSETLDKMHNRQHEKDQKVAEVLTALREHCAKQSK